MAKIWLCLCGICVVGLCFFNIVITSSSNLIPFSSFFLDAFATLPEKNSWQSSSASPPSVYSARSPTPGPTNLARNDNGYIPKVDVHQVDYSQPDLSDSIFQRWGWVNDPVIIEKYKLLFFPVPKVSCTEWLSLFRRMMNYSDWHSAAPHDVNSNGLRYLGHYSRNEQIEFMTSPNWTRAIFVREPMERLLSAFLNKAHGSERFFLQYCCVNPNAGTQLHLNNSFYKRQCQVLQRLGENGPTPQDFSFQNFVEAFMVQCKDDHWRLQSDRMKPTNWKYINFVGHFDTLAEDARSLLEKIGAWEEYGATGWGDHGNLSFFQKNFAQHATSAKSRLEVFYIPEVLEPVLQYLKADYDHVLFNFSRPNMTTIM
jgi:hypothetical protein